MTCRECADFLSDYVAGELPAGQLATFERHLAACPNCEEYMRQYHATIVAERTAFAEEPTGDIPEELVRAILAARNSR
ncbi:MAG TPA: zf-HC2 domain-containing protein [Vicinamibacterales bacterium]|nr:zf-HC2 domain-containing protein [Vicinamibacterales bacterium]